MFLEIERIERLNKELLTYSYPLMTEVSGYEIKKGKMSYSEALSADGWQCFNSRERWGGRLEEDRHYWFRVSIIVPQESDGKTVIYHLKTGAETGWDLANPQLLVYVNGVLIQGLDIRHRDIILCENAKAGDTYNIMLFAYAGINGGLSELESQISSYSSESESLYYDIKIPLDVAKLLDKQDKHMIDILKYLSAAVNMLDFRKPFSASYFEGINNAREFLKTEFYEKHCGDGDIFVSCVGHTHIDTAWLWTLSQTREKVVRSFSTVLNLMKRYPEYIFMSSQPQLYEYFKEAEPEIYEQIKQRVRDGRWEPEGAMWVEADCNVTSGESLVRQILFGIRFFMEEFGVKNEILWLPDVFGYSAALPQIMAKTGLKYFMTTKLGWNEYNGMPHDTFMWRGIDGTEVLTHFITAQSPTFMPTPHAVSYNGRIDAPHLTSAWKKYSEKALHNEVLMAFGYGDGGGGPTREMLEASRRFEKGIPTCPKTKIEKSIDFFSGLSKIADKSPKWVGELYLEFHRGTLTTMGRNKRSNRKAEFLYRDAELWSTAADKLLSMPYPQDKINSGWKKILLNQFHDIIPGSAIKEVYEDSARDYNEVNSIGNAALNTALFGISKNINLNADSIVVFNQLSRERSDIVTLKMGSGDFKILDVCGNILKSQMDSDGNLSFFAENVPSMGYKAFKIEKSGKSAEKMTASSEILENKFFRIQLDKNANFTSIYDKLNDREVLKSGERGNVIQAFEDKPYQYDAWEINIYYEEKMWEMNDVKSIKVIENGAVYAKLRVVKTFIDSEFTQDIVIYSDIPRIDFICNTDWKEKDILLKAAFPVDINADKATYEIQYGSLERPTHKNTSWDLARFEVCGHKWADLSEAGYGVSLLNDCKYGHDIHDGVMRLTLLRCPTDPNPNADKEIHNFTYSIYPHSNDWRTGGTVAMAYDLNCPLTAVLENAHDGALNNSYSYAKSSCDNVIIEVVKKAEDSDDTIIRVYECYGKRTRANLNFSGEITAACECDMLENELSSIKISDNSFGFTIKPYEIKTFLVR